MTDMPDSESPFLKRIAAMNAMYQRIPRGSWGVVAVDPLEHEPGEELYLIAVYASRVEAEAALAKQAGAEGARSDWIASRLFVYEGEGPADAR
jgi:hypothetical protein